MLAVKLISKLIERENLCSHLITCAVGSASPDAALQPPMMLIFGPGQPARQCLNISIPSDSITEGGEVFQVNAVSLTPAACSANPNNTQVCIQEEGISLFCFSQNPVSHYLNTESNAEP